MNVVSARKVWAETQSSALLANAGFMQSAVALKATLQKLMILYASDVAVVKCQITTLQKK